MRKSLFMAALLGIMVFVAAGRSESADKGGPTEPSANLQNAPLTMDRPQMTDIHDIKALRSPGPNRWLIYGLPAAALAVLLASLWLYKHRKNRPGVEKAPPCDPPHVTATKALKALERLEDLDGRHFYFRLSAILRGYLAARFGIDALEMTIEELLPAIGQLELEDPLRQPLAQLLRRAEPIKFAGRPADKNDMHSDLSFGREFVTQTAIVEPA
jgi:hypothetical protein